MGGRPRADGSLPFGEVAAIVVLATAGLVVVGAISLVSSLIDRLWPGASKVGPLSFDPLVPIPPDDAAAGPQNPTGPEA